MRAYNMLMTILSSSSKAKTEKPLLSFKFINIWSVFFFLFIYQLLLKVYKLSESVSGPKLNLQLPLQYQISLQTDIQNQTYKNNENSHWKL